MNIFSIKGHKVKCVNHDSGYDYEQKTARKHLVIGQEYTIEKTNVEGWYTNVYLQEFPDIIFNSTFFEDVRPQSIEETEKHPDYKHFKNHGWWQYKN